VRGAPGNRRSYRERWLTNVFTFTKTVVTINELWYSRDENAWLQALQRYMRYVKPADVELVRELEPLDLGKVRQLDVQGWYDFLYHKYFRWKYTAPNRLATTRRSLAKYVETGTLDELFSIKEQLLSFPTHDIARWLRIASSIRGLGIAGASGLLTLMYPEHFGTVDQFVVKALRQVDDLPQRTDLERMNPDGLKLSDGVVLIQIMREKAAENNRVFRTSTWTPKKIDEILWTYGR
jgi:hypothetical protein